MKWLYVIIAFLFISLLLCCFELKRIDQRYSALIENGSTQLRLIQRLTYNSNRRHILLYNAAHCKDTTQRRLFLNEMHKLGKANTNIFDSLILINSEIPDQVQAVKDAIQARKRYAISTRSYLDSAKAGSRQWAGSDFSREQKLESVFQEYQKRINGLFYSKNENVLLSSDRFSLEAEKSVLLILGFSLLPLVAMTLVVTVITVLLRYAIRLFGSELR